MLYASTEKETGRQIYKELKSDSCGIHYSLVWSRNDEPIYLLLDTIIINEIIIIKRKKESRSTNSQRKRFFKKKNCSSIQGEIFI